MTPIEQVRAAVREAWYECPEASPGDRMSLVADAVEGFLTEVIQPEIDRLTAVASAAGQGWKAATDEAEKAHERIVLLEGEIEIHLKDLRAGDLERERQRQKLADAKRWIYSYKGLPLTELRTSLELAVRHSNDYGLSSVCVDLPTGEDLFELLSQATTRSPGPETPTPDRSPPG